AVPATAGGLVRRPQHRSPRRHGGIEMDYAAKPGPHPFDSLLVLHDPGQGADRRHRPRGVGEQQPGHLRGVQPMLFGLADREQGGVNLAVPAPQPDVSLSVFSSHRRGGRSRAWWFNRLAFMLFGPCRWIWSPTSAGSRLTRTRWKGNASGSRGLGGRLPRLRRPCRGGRGDSRLAVREHGGTQPRVRRELDLVNLDLIGRWAPDS